MTPENELALIIAYYLAKFDSEAVRNLGYATQREAFDRIGERLGVKRNTVKNMRDQFDPLFSSRVGWYQRPLPPSRRRVVEVFGAVSEPALRSFVLDALASRSFSESETGREIRHAVTGPVGKDELIRESFLQRGATGRAAEEFFLRQFHQGKTPFSGELFDAREYGAGFDFQVTHKLSASYIEVKGLAAGVGGILFTDKEWETACGRKTDYHAAIVLNATEGNRSLSYVQDPAAIFKPRRYTSTAVSVSWQVPANQISAILR